MCVHQIRKNICGYAFTLYAYTCIVPVNGRDHSVLRIQCRLKSDVKGDNHRLMFVHHEVLLRASFVSHIFTVNRNNQV